MLDSPSPTVQAMWVGPYGDRFPDGTVLVPNETVCLLPRGEAELSDNWKVVDDAPLTDEQKAEAAAAEAAAAEAAAAEAAAAEAAAAEADKKKRGDR